MKVSLHIDCNMLEYCHIAMPFSGGRMAQWHVHGRTHPPPLLFSSHSSSTVKLCPWRDPHIPEAFPHMQAQGGDNDGLRNQWCFQTLIQASMVGNKKKTCKNWSFPIGFRLCWYLHATKLSLALSCGDELIVEGKFSIREVVKKKRISYGQADRKGWPPPLTVRCFFLGLHLTLVYDYT